MRLRVDPWNPEYGASVEIETELDPVMGLDLTVETAGAWAPIRSPRCSTVPRCAFVDGVRRVEARLFGEDGGLSVPGLAGSWAAGCAWTGQPPAVSDIDTGREIVMGGGRLPPPLTARVGPSGLSFRPSAVPGSAPLDPLRGLQNAMRQAEAGIARTIVSVGAAELVVADGPLSYAMPGRLIGMIKRQSRAYLNAERARIIPDLRAGDRTPLFKLGEQRLERYSWYLRLTNGRSIDGAMAGVVRLETDAACGIDAAREIADLAGSVLPMLASQPGRDPRAPQNVYPVGALEARLRHRLGDAQLIRRAIEARLLEDAGRG